MHKGGFVFGLLTSACIAALAHAETSGASRYPSPERAWTKADYVRFYFAHFNGNHALPHLRDAQMQAVFDRLVSEDNLARLRTAALSDTEKLAELRLMLSALGEIRAAYNISVQVGEPLAEELTRVQIFTLAVLSDAIQASIVARQAPSRAWTTTLFGVVISLGEAAIYTPAQRRDLADALALHFQSLHPVLSDKMMQKIAEQIGTLAARERDKTLRQSLQRLLEATRG